MSRFLSQYWWALIMSATLILWTWRALRRSRRIEPSAMPLRQRAEPSGSRPYLRRDAFAAQAELIRLQMVKGVTIAIALCLVGFPLTFALAARVAGLSSRVVEAAFVGICFGAVAAMLVAAFRGGRRMRHLGLVCPVCKGELVGSNAAGAWLQDRVLETGLCPHCQAPLLDPSEVGPVPAPRLSLSGHLGAIGILVAMLISLGAVVYFGSASIRAKRSAYCARRYARAESSADSAAVDTVSFRKGGTATCGELRRRGVS